MDPAVAPMFSFGISSSYQGVYIAIDMGRSVKLAAYRFALGSTYCAPRQWRVYATNDVSAWLSSPSCCAESTNVRQCDGLNPAASKGWVLLDDRSTTSMYAGSTLFQVPPYASQQGYRILVLLVNALVGDPGMAAGSSAGLCLREWTLLAGGASCGTCAAGTYSNALSAIGSWTCLRCPVNTYSAVPGATDATACVACPNGTISAEGSASCNAAQTPAPTQAPTPAPVATPAPAPTPTLTSCLPGTYWGGSQCAQCPAGTYLGSQGAMEVEQCVRCPDNTY